VPLYPLRLVRQRRAVHSSGVVADHAGGAVVRQLQFAVLTPGLP
jgi:hypothetical protein